MEAATSPDPILLSTTELEQRSNSTNQRKDAMASQSADDQTFSIVLRHLPPDEKEKYVVLKLNVLEIAGEYREGQNSYYYALLGDKKYHKLRVEVLTDQYPDLVEDYERKKERGSIPPFDPTSSKVHSSSRVHLSIKLNKNQVSAAAFKRSRRTTLDFTLDSNPGSESEEEDSPSEYDEDGSPVKLRRSSRTTSGPKKKTVAPNTRSRKTRTVPDSEADESEVEENIAPTRRSTRTAAKAKAPIIDDDYVDGDFDSDTDDYDGSSPKPKIKPKPKAVRGKASRPAYGHFRSVADIDFDSCSDEETVPLRAHRDDCEKCRRAPTNILLGEYMKKKSKQKSKKKNKDEFEEEDDDREKLANLGGWVRCLKCPVSTHWKCLNSAQRAEILKAAHDRAVEEYNQQHPPKEDPEEEKIRISKKPPKFSGLGAYQITEFICNYCIKGGVCMGCKEVALKPDSPPVPVIDKAGDLPMDQVTKPPEVTNGPNPHELFFRCLTCKRLAHYAHLAKPSGFNEDVPISAIDLAHHYQQDQGWTCWDCSSYTAPVDKILAWRPYPANAVETSDMPNYKDQLPREYLIKWQGRSYRRTQWVPHMWLLSTHTGKLSNFAQGKSPKVDLLKEPVKDGEEIPTDISDERTEGSAPPPVFGDVEESRSPTPPVDVSISGAIPDAERRIPPAWKTVDRVLDILLWAPAKQKTKTNKRLLQVESDSEPDEAAEKERTAAFELGEEPDGSYTMTLEKWEKKNNRRLEESDINLVIWSFTKWKDLGYDESSWDSPPRLEEAGYSSFQYAFKRFLDSRDVQVSKLSKAEAKAFDNRPAGEYRKKHEVKETPDLGQSDAIKLMDFQVDGVDWLCSNWWVKQHCILADEMGLGKTVQIAAFIGILTTKFNVSPSLVVVPNSTITNWVREFERWAPRIRVVPYYGGAGSREVIRNFELSHNHIKSGTTGAKYHVLVTTYETLTNPKEFGLVFNSVPRWETLVVDEGQRLKSDSSLIFKKLNELNTLHRIILTGTPLNNNIRELFNLMNFLDPEEWKDLRELEKEHEVLTEELVKELHTRLRPYFLRRIKSEVLKLPPKNEVIVPVSMTPLQKEVYRSILSQNLDILKSLTQPADAKAARAIKRTNLNNMLMQLRKCLQHPYLVSEEIEPKGLAPDEVHGKLIDASAKLLLLKSMLPKLKARGHRILLFSQFKMVLNVVEDFLDGEGVKHLRLDGDTPSAERQKGIDEYNREGSDVFVYLLTTRAGGVGINLYTADTVIIFDPDFNPHQDLQAIARAHRYGIQKTCLVFKLMVKNSAEDRIMQMGKKKLALEHVIVQKMDEDGPGEDVQSILTFGARQLFEEGENDRSIIYTDADIDSLIEKTEKEGDKVEEHGPSMTFSFAKIWASDKDGTEEMADTAPESAEADSWAQTLQRIASEKEQVQAKEVTGRGAKRKAAAVFPQQRLDDIDSPGKSKSRKKSNKKRKATPDSDDTDNYMGSGHESADETDATSSVAPDDLAQLLNNVNPRRPKPANGAPLAPIQNTTESSGSEACGLCNSMHLPGHCAVTQSSVHLADFRLMLMTDAENEPLALRRAAIQAIDETLKKRGDLKLLHGQPMHIVDPNPPPRKKSRKPKAAKQPGASHDDAPVAGPSKRPAPAPPSAPPAKKIKMTVPTNCVACGQAFHDLRECSVVLAGPSSIAAVMKRLLEDNPSDADTKSTIQGLKHELKKQRRVLLQGSSDA